MTIDTIIVPQGAEYKAVCRGLQQAGTNKIQTLAIPIGTKKIVQTLANYSSKLDRAKNIVIVGLCGSLSEQYSVGEAVLYRSCSNLDGGCLNLESELTTAIQKKLSVSLVNGITSDRIICQTVEKQAFSKTYSVNVVDMEGYDYIQEFQARNIQVAVMRVVSDGLTGDIPDLSKAIDPDGNLKSIPMATAFLKQPIAASRLIKGSLRGLNTLQKVTQQLHSLTENRK